MSWKTRKRVIDEIDSIDQNLVQVMAQIDILNGEITDKEVPSARQKKIWL